MKIVFLNLFIALIPICYVFGLAIYIDNYEKSNSTVEEEVAIVYIDENVIVTNNGKKYIADSSMELDPTA